VKYLYFIFAIVLWFLEALFMSGIRLTRPGVFLATALKTGSLGPTAQASIYSWPHTILAVLASAILFATLTYVFATFAGPEARKGYSSSVWFFIGAGLTILVFLPAHFAGFILGVVIGAIAIAGTLYGLNSSAGPFYYNNYETVLPTEGEEPVTK
jgi:hypothetical protein